MKVKLKNVLKGYILIIGLITFVIVCLKNVNLKIYNLDFEIIVTFIVIGVVIVLNVVMDNRTYSLNKIFWYFSFFFLFLAPLFQYMTGYEVWGHKLSHDSLVKTNYTLIIWFILYAITYKFTKIKEKKEKKEIQLKNSIVNFFIILSFIALLVAIVLIGFKELFSRSSNQVDLGVGFVNTVVSNFIRTVPVYALSYSLYYYKKNKLNILKIIILLLLLLALNYPISTTRYWIGTVYIGIAIIAFGKLLRSKTFDIGIVFVFAIIFPLFQIFKWYTIEDLINGTATFNLATVYNNVDFDAYSILVRAFEYVNSFGITYGKQLLSSLLFFIPRAIWPTKTIPTGELIATAQNQFFTNISAPLQAEGLINFGYIGVIIYAIILAKIVKYMDVRYWEKERDGTHFIDYIYPFSLGLLIFLLRGAFHPVIVYTFTFFLLLIIWKIWCILKKQLKKHTE